MRYMSFLGLFLFKDLISLGASFYLISYFGKKAILSEKSKPIAKTILSTITERVAFLLKDLVLFAVSLYLLKQIPCPFAIRKEFEELNYYGTTAGLASALRFQHRRKR